MNLSRSCIATPFLYQNLSKGIINTVSLNFQNEKEFEKLLIGEYIRLGSIEQVFHTHKFTLPISFASYHRLLNKKHIVKSAGPNSKLSESLNFLSQLSDYKVPLERVYHKHAPTSMQVSTNTLHRMLHYIRLGLTRRRGTALLVSPESNLDTYLLAQDKSLTNSDLGRAGDFSLPMSHSRGDEKANDSIARVLQQEMFSDETCEGSFPWDLLPKDPKPVMYINIADIKVSVYRLILPDGMKDFSSFRLDNYSFFDQNTASKLKLRPGVGDIIKKFEEIRFLPQTQVVPEFDSTLNAILYAWCSKI